MSNEAHTKDAACSRLSSSSHHVGDDCSWRTNVLNRSARAILTRSSSRNFKASYRLNVCIWWYTPQAAKIAMMGTAICDNLYNSSKFGIPLNKKGRKRPKLQIGLNRPTQSSSHDSPAFPTFRRSRVYSEGALRVHCALWLGLNSEISAKNIFSNRLAARPPPAPDRRALRHPTTNPAPAGLFFEVGRLRRTS